MAHGFQAYNMVQLDDGSQAAQWRAITLKSAFQPIYRFKDGKLVIDGFEALVRPFQGDEAISPPEFFNSVPVGERMQVEVLTRALHIMNAGEFLDPRARLFMNFNPSVYAERSRIRLALRAMCDTLMEAKVATSRIVCEVTEQKSASPQALRGFIALMRELGFKIAVDDYGAEDSDMDRVVALAPDIVKFDAGWVSRLMQTRPGVALLAMMVSTFTKQGCEVVFEGLEEDWQLEVAEEVGAHMVQGFVLGRPELAPTSFALPAALRRSSRAASEPQEQLPRPASGSTAAMPPRIPPARPFGRRN